MAGNQMNFGSLEVFPGKLLGTGRLLGSGPWNRNECGEAEKGQSQNHVDR